WEDRDDNRDFQERFSKDYIRTESIGLQHGNVPMALVLVKSTHDDARRRWLMRTAAGVLLTHEIKPLAGQFDAYWDNFFRMLDFGYGTSQVRVWNYWDPAQPFRWSRDDLATLVLSK